MDSNAKEKYQLAQQLHQVLLRLDRLVAGVACRKRTDLLVESLDGLSAKEWKSIGAASTALARLFGYREC